MNVAELPINMKKRVYFENLDGLRFFCILSVFLYHSFYTENQAIIHSSFYHYKYNHIHCLILPQQLQMDQYLNPMQS